MFFVLAAGGCGGGGGGKDDDYSYDPSIPDSEFSALSGTWVARDGGGTASYGGESLDFKLRSGTIELNILNATQREVTARIKADFIWEVYDGNRFVDTLPRDLDGQVVMSRIGDSDFRFTDEDGVVFEITVYSETVMSVKESGNEDGISYHTSYYMDKQ
jgi:hypothetical protein